MNFSEYVFLPCKWVGRGFVSPLSSVSSAVTPNLPQVLIANITIHDSTRNNEVSSSAEAGTNDYALFPLGAHHEKTNKKNARNVIKSRPPVSMWRGAWDYSEVD